MQRDPPSRKTVKFYGTKHPDTVPDVIGGFYSYGDTRWTSVYEWTSEFWLTGHGNANDLRYLSTTPGQEASDNDVVIHAADYHGRRRVPTMSNTETRGRHYRERTRERDNYTCLITNQQLTAARVKAAHIFPRSFDHEWARKEFAKQITDPAPLDQIGGHLKSTQYKMSFCCDNYKVIGFTQHYGDIHGKHLRLDHILDPNIRPLDTLLRDHFKQCLFKNMCGAGEDEDEFDFELDPFEPNSLDMSDTPRWTSSQGQHLFEHSLRDRLLDHRVAQECPRGRCAPPSGGEDASAPVEGGIRDRVNETGVETPRLQ
ncbi:hypothetical protein BKA62DRAFT_831079 [Auriculariales sp. MPI-PUGE-AT-0066]|nr:hypothetical protein BKA62DRAFT_831079 [Auriculariales sp. MPI-PUGE-AT-0066]